MKKIIIANWKMNPATLKEAKEIFGAVKKIASNLKKVETVICPPFVYLETLGGLASKPKRLSLQVGAQDVSLVNNSRDIGAFTGEVSAGMLKNLGVKYMIVGHSERRALGETNEIINKKLKAVLSAGIKAILCIGENEHDSDGKYLHSVSEQINEGLKNISAKLLKNLIVAYEPVWAISSNSGGVSDSPESAFQMSIFIRRVLLSTAGGHLARVMPILYGGSVNSKNAQGFLKDAGMQGLLVGSKSLDAKEFGEILKIANKC